MPTTKALTTKAIRRCSQTRKPAARAAGSSSRAARGSHQMNVIRQRKRASRALLNDNKRLSFLAQLPEGRHHELNKTRREACSRSLPFQSAHISLRFCRCERREGKSNPSSG